MDRIWYCIKGYNGYEYSNDGLLRSMKNFNKYPHGKLLKRYTDKENRVFFYLSDNNNERQKVYRSTIIDILSHDDNLIIRGDYDTDISSRNRIVNKKKNRTGNPLNEYIGIPKFKIIDEKHQAIKFY